MINNLSTEALKKIYSYLDSESKVNFNNYLGMEKLDKLPNEIFVKIFSFLQIEEANNFCLYVKKIHENKCQRSNEIIDIILDINKILDNFDSNDLALKKTAEILTVSGVQATSLAIKSAILPLTIFFVDRITLTNNIDISLDIKSKVLIAISIWLLSPYLGLMDFHNEFRKQIKQQKNESEKNKAIFKGIINIFQKKEMLHCYTMLLKNNSKKCNLKSLKVLNSELNKISKPTA